MYEDRSIVASASASASPTTAVVATTAATSRRRRRRARPLVAGRGATTVLTAATTITVTVTVILLLFSTTAKMIVAHSHEYSCATNTAFIVGTAGRGEPTRSPLCHYAAGTGRVRSSSSSSSTSANCIKRTIGLSMLSCRSGSENDDDEIEGDNYDSSNKCGSRGTSTTKVATTTTTTTTRRQAIKVFFASSMISSTSFLLPSVQNNINDNVNDNNISIINNRFNPNVVANALSPTEAEDAYDKYAPTYNQLDGDDQITSLLGIDEARTELFQKASGRVLEIGCGTGLNLPRYDYSKISSLTLMDISQGMINEAQKRLVEDPTLTNLISSNNVQIEFIQGDATSQLVEKFSTSLDDNGRSDSTSSSSSSQPLLFDTVVDSFSLCVMGNDGAKRCLQQMSTVVKPTTGRILLLENSRSSNNVLGWYQDITASNAATMGGKGCVYNQDVRSMIEDVRDPYAKLQIIKEQQYAAGLFRSFECRRA